MWRFLDRRPLAQDLESAISVLLHAQLALDHADDLAVGVDDEGVALHGDEAAAALDPEDLAHLAVGIGEEGEVEGVLVGELLLLLDGVGADTHPLTAGVLELLLQV